MSYQHKARRENIVTAKQIVAINTAWAQERAADNMIPNEAMVLVVTVGSIPPNVATKHDMRGLVAIANVIPPDNGINGNHDTTVRLLSKSAPDRRSELEDGAYTMPAKQN